MLRLIPSSVIWVCASRMVLCMSFSFWLSPSVLSGVSHSIAHVLQDNNLDLWLAPVDQLISKCPFSLKILSLTLIALFHFWPSGDSLTPLGCGIHCQFSYQEFSNKVIIFIFLNGLYIHLIVKNYSLCDCKGLPCILSALSSHSPSHAESPSILLKGENLLS